ncbi:hypothetical protein BEL04_04035 [Mucilaginibacter sp. PPCGB 2223]|uniref:DUF1800 domain-containing protein n=1 Tax=Mucilaginibacter sp. PPCGB 2223 TaxID=1886027 RepID=UPI0008242E6E|nr:DUF1800 domain-containing protein [Mucilaginibacter sp. PPCGB 2223]OCX53479.1 hypothetical protein BEL04_04035 [Mucilaginibacter sp. PPCGB 2223]
MKAPYKYLLLFVAIAASAVALSSFFRGPGLPAKSFAFPYKQAGLTERQAAAHLLNRFTYGATPGEVDAVVKIGLEKWFQQQLEAKQADPALDSMLAQYKDLTLSNEQIVAEYPKNGQLVRMAVKEGIISKDSVNNLKADKKEYREQIKAYMDKNGLKPQQELLRQFVNAKIFRAAYTNNQLQEVLTDFWFNHFNVSFTKNDCAEFIPVYERDAIRPNVLGKFDKILLATAKSPAMLYFLDNFSSVGVNTNAKQPNARRAQFIQQQQEQMMQADPNSPQAKFLANAQKARKAQGLNENYAREVMELHTLGVDGGYTQSDVTQAAKVLTGWTIFPMNDGYGNAARKIVDTYGTANMEKNGFVRDGDFLFNANRHDEGQKVVLGHTFPAGGGYQEGVDLLEMLAHHPSTAKFITKKIAVRFVSDTPPQSLLDKMAKSFTDHDGDIKEVLITMASSPEFWSAQSLREKTKSPFELAISSVRALDAHITAPYPLYLWITKMGQKLYYYQAPTGFPDRGQYWINTGALLNRMNFGLALATKRIPGITFDLKALNNNREPESAQEGLVTYGKLIMPERNLDQTIARLTPMLNDPDLGKKIDEAAGKTKSVQDMNAGGDDNNMMQMADNAKNYKAKLNKGGGAAGDRLMYAMQNSPGQNSMLSQVVGILIGSPEYQRR